MIASIPAEFHTTIQDTRVPSLGFGTFQLNGHEAVYAVEHALDVGYRHIDTASIYRNEVEVGSGIANSPVDRGDVFLTTKIRWDSLRADAVRRSAEQSLCNLGTDYIDLLLIHWPNTDVSLEETLSEMLKVRDEGKARLLGVSNFPPSWLKRAIDLAPIFCNQIEYHPLLGQEALLDLSREHDILLTAYSPLAQGAVFAENRLREIGKKYGKTASQVVLRWLIQQDRVAAIPRSGREVNRAVNFDIWDFELDDADMDRIADMDREERFVRPHWEPDWER